MDESRKHERMPVSLRPRYRVATKLDYTESPCVDLSEGGMFIESPEPAQPGTLVKVECSAASGVFRALGEVAWRRPGRDDAPGGMGIRFLKLDPGGGDIVRELMASARLPQAAGMAIPMERHNTWITVAALTVMMLGAFFLAVGSR